MEDVSKYMKNREQGAAMTEFAIVLPLLIFFLFGIVQYGWIFAAKLSLLNTINASARYSTLGAPRPTQDDVKAFINSNVMIPIDKTNINSISIIENANGVTDLREVTVVYNFKLFLPFLVPGHNNGILQLSATGQML